MYAKGHEEDEKLHKAYHTGALQGFRFKVCGCVGVWVCVCWMQLQ